MSRSDQGRRRRLVVSDEDVLPALDLSPYFCLLERRFKIRTLQIVFLSTILALALVVTAVLTLEQHTTVTIHNPNGAHLYLVIDGSASPAALQTLQQ